MAKIKEMPSQEIIRELIDYNPATGETVWLPRDSKWFEGGKRDSQWEANRWNSKNAGKAITRTSNGYILASIFGEKIFLHRLIWKYMTGEEPVFVDHKNGIKDDNRWDNLQNATKKTNGRNMKLFSTNTSGHVGIRQRSGGRWQARIKVDQKEQHIGMFDTYEEAIEAWNERAKLMNFSERHGN